MKKNTNLSYELRSFKYISICIGVPEEWQIYGVHSRLHFSALASMWIGDGIWAQIEFIVWWDFARYIFSSPLHGWRLCVFSPQNLHATMESVSDMNTSITIFEPT